MNINDLVLIPRLGVETFRIIKVLDSRQFLVESSLTGVSHEIYQVHCFEPHSLRMENVKRRVERAQKIGREKIERAQKIGRKRS